MLVQRFISTKMNCKPLDLPYNEWAYVKEVKVEICPGCSGKRRMRWLLTKSIISTSDNDCKCVEKGVEKSIEKVKRELSGIGFYTRYMVGYDKGLVLLEVHVIILEEDAKAFGKFKLKNLHTQYRKL